MNEMECLDVLRCVIKGSQRFGTLAIEWPTFLSFCKKHKIDAYILSLIETDDEHFIEAKKQSAIDKIRIYFLQQTRYKESKDVYSNLIIEGVPYAVIKGVFLGQTIYGTDYTRDSTDIDLLISHDDRAKVNDILTSLGYIQGLPDENRIIHEYSSEIKLFYLLNTHQVAPYIKPLNNNLLPYSGLDVNLTAFKYDAKITKHFLDDAEIHNYANINYSVLPIEKNLLHYCMHNFKEINNVYLLMYKNGFSLCKFLDIYLFIVKNSDRINWMLFNHLIEKYNIAGEISAMLYYTSLLFDAPELIDHFDRNVFTTIYVDCFSVYERPKKWGNSIIDRVVFNNYRKILLSKIDTTDIKSIEMNVKYM